MAQGGGLDLGRQGRAARRRRLARCGLGLGAAALALALGMPRALALWPALPRQLAAWAAPGAARRIEALEQDNRALRAAAADAVLLEEENAALRALAGSPRRASPGPCAPAQVVRRALGERRAWLYCADGGVQPGAALLDRCGRYAGRVEQVEDDGAHFSARMPDPVGCRAEGGAAGYLRAEAQGWVLTALPLPTPLHAGALAVTWDGHWLGRLAQEPEPDAGALTAHALLTDTAREADTLYFVASG